MTPGMLHLFYLKKARKIIVFSFSSDSIITRIYAPNMPRQEKKCANAAIPIQEAHLPPPATLRAMELMERRINAFKYVLIHNLFGRTARRKVNSCE
jgi:hypothetical protein